jgi:hypothetical protein
MQLGTMRHAYNPALRKQRPEDLQFKPGLHSKILTQRERNKQMKIETST